MPGRFLLASPSRGYARRRAPRGHPGGAGRLDANGGQQGGQRGHPHIVYLWHDAGRVRTCPSGYGHLATCDETDPKKQPPISHEKCPKVHDMWVKSVAAHPPFPGIFSCHLVPCARGRHAMEPERRRHQFQPLEGAARPGTTASCKLQAGPRNTTQHSTTRIK